MPHILDMVRKIYLLPQQLMFSSEYYLRILINSLHVPKIHAKLKTRGVLFIARVIGNTLSNTRMLLATRYLILRKQPSQNESSDKTKRLGLNTK